MHARRAGVGRVRFGAGIDDRVRDAAAHHLALHEQRVLEARRIGRRRVVGVVAVHEEVAADLPLAPDAAGGVEGEAAVPAPVTSGQAMPEAVMLARAPSASEAAWCDAASRSATPRRCWPPPWYACRPAKTQAAVGRRVRDDPVRERAGRRGATPQRPWPTSISTKTSIVAPLPRHRRRQPLDPFGRVDRDRQPRPGRPARRRAPAWPGRSLRWRCRCRRCRRRRAPPPRWSSGRRRQPPRRRAAAARSPRTCASSRAAGAARRARRANVGHGREVAVHRVEVDDERRRVDARDRCADGDGDGDPRVHERRAAALPELAAPSRPPSPPSPASSSGMSPSRCCMSFQPTSVKPRAV